MEEKIADRVVDRLRQVFSGRQSKDDRPIGQSRQRTLQGYAHSHEILTPTVDRRQTDVGPFVPLTPPIPILGPAHELFLSRTFLARAPIDRLPIVRQCDLVFSPRLLLAVLLAVYLATMMFVEFVFPVLFAEPNSWSGFQKQTRRSFRNSKRSFAVDLVVQTHFSGASGSSNGLMLSTYSKRL